MRREPWSDRLDVSLRRQYVDDFHFRHVAGLRPGSRVADLGGHKAVRRGQFDISQYQLEVVCVNLSDEKGADVIADAAQLPFDDASFDAVICSELLEHVPDPRAVLVESARILKPQGTLLVCVPFLYHIHADPHDYGRYTPYFWQTALHEAGFEQVEIEHQGCFWSVVVDMLREKTNQLAGQRRPRFKPARSLAKRMVVWAKQKAIEWDRRALQDAPAESQRFATGFGIQARRAG